MTRNGVYYDLSKSPYLYTENDITYIFSSKLHRSKFKKRLEENRISFTEKFVKKYGIEINVSLLADIMLYENIETRGFLIVVNGEGEFTCKNSLILDGEIRMKKSLTSLSEILMPKSTE